MDKAGFAAATYTGNGSPIGAAEQFDVTLTNTVGASVVVTGTLGPGTTTPAP